MIVVVAVVVMVCRRGRDGKSWSPQDVVVSRGRRGMSWYVVVVVVFRVAVVVWRSMS